jgi:hypothetical protein
MVWLLAALVPEREPELEPGLEPERVLELAQGLDCYMLRVILIIPA